MKLGVAFLVVMAGFAWPALAAAAVQLQVTNNPCAIYPCPLPPPVPTTVESRTPFLLAVVAIDATGSRDASYRGTVHFSSTDAQAFLPPTYIFTAADAGGKGFIVFLTTVGAQTITGTDDSVPPLSGSITLTVTAATQSIPTISRTGLVVLASALAVAGALVLRHWSGL